MLGDMSEDKGVEKKNDEGWWHRRCKGAFTWHQWTHCPFKNQENWAFGKVPGGFSKRDETWAWMFSTTPSVSGVMVQYVPWGWAQLVRDWYTECQWVEEVICLLKGRDHKTRGQRDMWNPDVSIECLLSVSSSVGMKRFLWIYVHNLLKESEFMWLAWGSKQV